jgi:hypothetical protein
MNPKILYSIQAALVFLVISSPFVYKLTDSLFGNIFDISVNGCPTIAGLLLHTVVYGIVVYVMMLVQKPKDDEEYILDDDIVFEEDDVDVEDEAKEVTSSIDDRNASM